MIAHRSYRYRIARGLYVLWLLALIPACCLAWPALLCYRAQRRVRALARLWKRRIEVGIPEHRRAA